MPTFEDVGKGVEINNNLQDELKPNGQDLLPFEDFNSGWILLARNATVTLTHDFGSMPRLAQILVNDAANDTSCFLSSAGYNSTAFAKIDLATTTTVRITNLSSNNANKYLKILLWR